MPISRTQMAEPRLLSKRLGKNYLRRVFLHPPNYQQNVNEQMISKAEPSLKEQANYIACLDQRGEKNDDTIADCRKVKMCEAKV